MTERLGTPESILDNKFDLIFVMGSTLDKNADGSFHYPSFQDWITNGGDPTNLDGDLKAQAIGEIYRSGLSPHVIITGGFQEGKSIRAFLLKQHAHDSYEVPMNFMTAIATEPHTLGNVESILQYLYDFPLELSPEKKIGILTMEFHIARTAAMLEKLKGSDKFFDNFDPEYISVDLLLELAGIISRKDIDSYHATTQMQERMTSEAVGIRHFQQGIYIPRS